MTTKTIWTLTYPEVLIGESVDSRPTKEVMIDIACILAGAGRLFEEAVCVSPERANEIFGVGYISPSMISKARSLAEDIFTNGHGRIEEIHLQRIPKVYD